MLTSHLLGKVYFGSMTNWAVKLTHISVVKAFTAPWRWDGRYEVEGRGSTLK